VLSSPHVSGARLEQHSAPSGDELPARVRRHLAAAQRDGEVSAEQVDIVERALAKVDGAGFDPENGG
jgi:hypothetical protein